MATEVVMPKLGLTMERGTVATWLVPEGGAVERGQPLLEVVTDKVTMEVDAQASGILRQILVPAGEEVDVATPIGVITRPDEELPPPVATSRADTAPPQVISPEAPRGDAAAVPTSDGRRPHRASPKARRMAGEHGLDLSAISGSGAGGRIVGADVESALARPPIDTGQTGAGRAAASPAAPPTASLLRQVVAERLTRSYREAPHIHLSADIDASWMALVRRGMSDRGKRVTYTDLMVRAVALSLNAVPELNALYVDGAVKPGGDIGVGIATDSPQGLVVPVVRRADQLELADLAAEADRLVQGARLGSLGPDDYSGGTFTVTNLGMYGVRSFTAILNPPQVGILAVGAVEDRVVPVGDEPGATPTLGIRPVVSVTLGLDHRALDGAAGARFLQHLRRCLESPGLLG